MKKLLFLILPTLIACKSENEEVPIVPEVQTNFLVTDIRIGNTDKSYKDPEFWVAGKKITWQDEADSIWIADINPVTGEMIPTDGRGKFIGKAVAIEEVGNEPGSWNGPEWGFSQNGAQVYFTAKDANNIHQIARYSLNSDQTSLVSTGGSTFRSGPLPSKNANDPQTAVMYFMGRFRDNIGKWRRENENQDKSFPSAYFATSGPQWINEEKALATNVADNNGFVQVAKYDILTGTTQMLTSGNADKFDTYFFTAPEYGNKKMFLTTHAYEKPTSAVPSVANEIVIYQQNNNGNYEPFKTLTLSAIFKNEKFNHWSAEPFVYKGKTYLSCSVMKAGGTTYESLSDVYVMGIDGTKMVKVDKINDNIRCIDPESFPTEDKLFIYYYTIESGGIRALRKCMVEID